MIGSGPFELEKKAHNTEDDEQSVTYQGVCPEEFITERLGDLIDTELTNMANKSIICQRGLWFNAERSTKPEVLAIRLQNMENAQKERLVSNNLQKAATKATQLSAAEQVLNTLSVEAHMLSLQMIKKSSSWSGVGRGGEAMDAAFILTMLNYMTMKNTKEFEIYYKYI